MQTVKYLQWQFVIYMIIVQAAAETTDQHPPFNVLHASSYPFIQSVVILNFSKSDLKPFTPFALPQNKEKDPQTSETASIFDVCCRLSKYYKTFIVHQQNVPNLKITSQKQAHGSPRWDSGHFKIKIKGIYQATLLRYTQIGISFYWWWQPTIDKDT